MVATLLHLSPHLSSETDLVLSVVGSFVFGVSGALAAIRARLDVFGVLVLAATVGLAGGIFRDVMLNLRPAALYDWRLIAAVTIGGILALLLRGPLEHWTASIEAFDAAGLAVFCVLGTEISVAAGAPPVAAILLGTATAVGGGVVRDLLLARVPFVLREGLYAVPALLGATVVVVGDELGAGGVATSVLAFLLCLAVRIVGMVFHVNLPVTGPEATRPPVRWRPRRDRPRR